jgi:hypothetical protein
MIRHSDRVVRITKERVLGNLTKYLKTDVVPESLEGSVEPRSDLRGLLDNHPMGLNAGLLTARSFASLYGVPEGKLSKDYREGRLDGMTVEGFADYIVSNTRGLAA